MDVNHRPKLPRDIIKQYNIIIKKRYQKRIKKNQYLQHENITKKNIQRLVYSKKKARCNCPVLQNIRQNTIRAILCIPIIVPAFAHCTANFSIRMDNGIEPYKL